MNKLISVFDTTIASYNLGNNIIMDAVYKELRQMFPESHFYKLPTMDIGKHTRSCIRESNFTIFGGTNSLNNDFYAYKQWDLRIRNINSVRNVILMGIGWWQYEEGPITRYTKFLLNQTLSTTYLHSVRDDYTKKKLDSIGIKSINTGCPTLWGITSLVLNEIPKKRSKNVVITITDYNKKPDRDRNFINTCFDCYDKVYCFPQGTGDYDYIANLELKRDVTFIPPTLDAFDQLLDTKQVDYIGTRLHAGIRALQKSVYALIIGIDNRANEKARDFNLPVIFESEVQNLSKRIEQRRSIKLNIPFENISNWKGQFRSP